MPLAARPVVRPDPPRSPRPADAETSDVQKRRCTACRTLYCDHNRYIPAVACELDRIRPAEWGDQSEDD